MPTTDRAPPATDWAILSLLELKILMQAATPQSDEPTMGVPDVVITQVPPRGQHMAGLVSLVNDLWEERRKTAELNGKALGRLFAEQRSHENRIAGLEAERAQMQVTTASASDLRADALMVAVKRLRISLRATQGVLLLLLLALGVALWRSEALGREALVSTPLVGSAC